MKSHKATVQLIRASKISQSELARRAGLTPTAVNRWMNQRVTNIRPSNVEAIASALGKEVVWVDHSRTECKFRDSGFNRESAITLETSQDLFERLFQLQRKFENIEESGRLYHPSRIDWHVGFAGWLQMQFEIDYEKRALNYPIRRAHDGTAYTWKEIVGYDKEELIGKDYLVLLHPVERDQVMTRSREITELSQKMGSTILETDRVFRLRHTDGHYEHLFIHSRINLDKKMAKCWCVPMPRIYS
ncbi:MAG: helix-turn-helix domain-containing protein [Candidatus Neomarinimicrobiota bacterium]|nr:helix-turn-helix domain-containing protein [Candidatus Neomarinimicrobiota bacterium]